jgi:O-acetyl-ADP-ribose deacetylase
VRGNLLEAPVDAIVNAANGHLAHGGGVAAAISRAAGPALPFKGVIHAVGPRQGEGGEEAKLLAALGAAFRAAADQGWQSVALPAVSSGIFAVPLDIRARAYVAAARASPLREVRLCLRDQPVMEAVLEEMRR